MTKNEIAIITDSSCDIPKEYLEQHSIFVLPLQVNTPKGQFLDGVTISPDEVYAGMPEVVPTTSQPSVGQIKQVLAEIKEQGYSSAVAVCMSAGLSGTYEAFCLAIKDETDLETHLVDTHRLSMALGLQVMQAVEMRDADSSAAEIAQGLKDAWENTNALFCMPSLSYLIKGGRIGLVSGIVGTLLKIVPVISINDDGVYFTYAKTRNYLASIKKIEETVRDRVKGKIADIAVMQGGAQEQAKKVYDSLKNVEGLRNIYFCQVSPAMGVHTGPGLFGICYRIVGDAS